jgi:hypothetical protein
MRALLVAVAVVVLASASEASAQLLQPPPRSADGVFGGGSANPNQSGHQLSADATALASYDQLQDESGLGGVSVTSDPLAENRSGSSALFAGNILYRYGRVERYVEAGARGFVHSVHGLDIRPVGGGDGSLRAGWTLGRASIFAGASAAYRPTLMLTASPSGPADVGPDPIAPADPTNGVMEMESTSKSLTSALDFNWNVRHTTSASLSYDDTLVTGLVTTNTQGHIETLTHSWAFRRTMSMELEYNYSHMAAEIDDEPTRPNNSHAGRLGLEWRKRLSRTRTLTVGGASGVMLVRSISSFDDGPLEYLAPSGSARVRVDLGRTWAVAVDADRSVTVLDGVSQQSFLTDVGSLWLGGHVGESWQVAVNGSFSFGTPHEGETGSYEAATARAQLTYAITSCCSLVGTYSYYSHLLHDISNLPPGFPNRSENNAVRVGVSFWLPLFGRFAGTRTSQTGRN